VPTPFYHIKVAEDLLSHKNLDRALRKRLEGQRCAFFLGNTAPDVQVVSGIPREATHFFTLPFRNNALPAWKGFLRDCPALADPGKLHPEHAAFLTGYLCHLQADWYWVKEIFAPIFGPTCAWRTFSERLYLHNVLRAYIDQIVMEGLNPGAGACLHCVKPQRWLPFVSDRDLEKWRDFLSRQLEPGALTETVTLLAERHSKTPEEFQDILNSEERMNQEIFARISRSRLDNFREKLLDDNIELIQAYHYHRF
jgi:hypothetical protein